MRMAKILIQLLTWTAAIALLILWPAGTLAYPGAWAFVALFGIGGGAITTWLFRHSPSLLRERMSAPAPRDVRPWDRVFLLLVVPAFFGWLVFMGWDAGRTGFRAVPFWLQLLGGAAVALYMLGVWWTFRENAFAAPVVKIQQGQKVIDTGPYAIVRHPMYASSLLLFAGLPLLLGSWWGLAVSALFVLAIAWRAVLEERTLRAELDGYTDYAARVRSRFIPGLW